MARRSALDTVLAARHTALTSTLPAALAGEPTAVHQARVASRRLREVLPILAVDDARTRRKARKAVRHVTRALGAIREIDVCLGLLDELTADVPLHASADASLRRALAAERATALAEARDVLSDSRQARLWKRLDAVERRRSHATAAAIATAAVRVARRATLARHLSHGTGVLYEPHQLHQVRIAVKRWRYALEVFTELRHVKPPALLADLRRVQDVLGRAHDLHVLGERIRGVEAGVVSRSRPAARALGRLVEAIEAACRREHGLFLGYRDALTPAGAQVRPARRRSAA